MRALLAVGPNGSADLRFETVADLEPSVDHVLIEVRCAGVTFADTLTIRGRYQTQRQYPFVPGFEVSGVVRAAPQDCGFSPGDEVIAFTGSGAFAELAYAQPRFVLPRSASLDWAQAAAYMTSSHTAYYALVVRGDLHPGETVLVHGAAGGLGVASVQVASMLGARVIALVSSEARAELARESGADCVVLLSDKWLDDVRGQAGGDLDMILDSVGGDRTEASLHLLRRGGRLLILGFASGQVPKLPAQRILNSDANILGVAWGPTGDPNWALTRDIERALAPLVGRGGLRPHISARYSLREGAKAVAALEGRGVLGKLVLDVSAS